MPETHAGKDNIFNKWCLSIWVARGRRIQIDPYIITLFKTWLQNDQWFISEMVSQACLSSQPISDWICGYLQEMKPTPDRVAKKAQGKVSCRGDFQKRKVAEEMMISHQLSGRRRNQPSCLKEGKVRGICIGHSPTCWTVCRLCRKIQIPTWVWVSVMQPHVHHFGLSNFSPIFL